MLKVLFVDTLLKLTWSGDVWDAAAAAAAAACRNANNLAWSGCKSALDRRRVRPTDGVGEPAVGVVDGDGEFDFDPTPALLQFPIPTTQLPLLGLFNPSSPQSSVIVTPGGHVKAFGEGDACTESIPESPAKRGSQNNEFRLPLSSPITGNTKLWPSASPRGESYKNIYIFNILKKERITIEERKIIKNSNYLTRPNLQQRQRACWSGGWWTL